MFEGKAIQGRNGLTPEKSSNSGRVFVLAVFKFC